MYLDLSSRTSGAALPRSNRPEVRNPVLGLPCAQRARFMPPEAREWLIEFLIDLRRDARERAEKAWRSFKAPQACYWRVIAVWSSHLVHALRKTAHSSSQEAS
jgi:hypothetical protein